MTKAMTEDNEVAKGLMARTPWGTWGAVQDVAQGALFLASDSAVWVTGVVLPTDVGFFWLCKIV